MITIGLIGQWLTLSAMIFFIFGIVFHDSMDESRAANTFIFLLAQGLTALLIWKSL